MTPGPAELIAVRHGQSLANALIIAADAAGLEESGLDSTDDAPVPLTDLGRAQAAAVGRYLATRSEPVDVVIASTYLRARQTAAIAVSGLPQAPVMTADARFRDRGKGVLALLTGLAQRRRYPEEAERLRQQGEYDYRPPGGESVREVGIRVREGLADLARAYAGQRVLVVAHDVVVLLLRQAFESIPDEQVWFLGPVHNGSVTRWAADGDGGLRLVEFNATAHLD